MAASEKKKILLTITGDDEPGQLAEFMQILRDHSITIEDIDQVTIYGHLVLVILIGIDEENPDHYGVLKDLLFCAKELGLDLDFMAMTDQEQAKAIYSPSHYVLSIIADKITPEQFYHITKVLGEKECNITKIRKLQDDPITCYELRIQFHKPTNPEEVQNYMSQLTHDTGVDIALQRESIFRRAKRLVVFDLDSTLIRQEVIDELADLAGVKDQVAKLTKEAMEGKIDFDEAFAQRVALFKGQPESLFDDVYDRLEFNDGVERLARILKKLGYKCAIISGGFLPVANRIKEALNFDYAFANQMEIVDGVITGKALGEVVNADKKAVLLRKLAEDENITTEQVIAIGDGANDLKMLAAAGMGVAYHAKPIVKEQTKVALNANRIDSVLALLGFEGPELGALLADNEAS